MFSKLSCSNVFKANVSSIHLPHIAAHHISIIFLIAHRFSEAWGVYIGVCGGMTSKAKMEYELHCDKPLHGTFA